MWRSAAVWVVLGVGGAVGCGGRYEQNTPMSDHTDHATSPAPANGGASGSHNASSGSGGTPSNDGGGGTPSNDGGGSTVAGSAGATQVACADQYSAYQDYRSQVMAEFSSFGCKLDDDCRSFYFQSACDPSCVLVTTAALRGVIDRLNTFASFDCTLDCWPPPWATCPAAAPVHCVSGRCQPR